MVACCQRLYYRFPNAKEPNPHVIHPSSQINKHTKSQHNHNHKHANVLFSLPAPPDTGIHRAPKPAAVLPSLAIDACDACHWQTRRLSHTRIQTRHPSASRQAGTCHFHFHHQCATSASVSASARAGSPSHSSCHSQYAQALANAYGQPATCSSCHPHKGGTRHPAATRLHSTVRPTLGVRAHSSLLHADRLSGPLSDRRTGDRSADRVHSHRHHTMGHSHRGDHIQAQAPP